MIERIEIEKGARIFVLEDLPDRQKIFREKLVKCDLVMVDSVPAAVTALSTSSFDCIFLDHDLDRRNGVPSDDPNCGSRVAEFLAKKGTETIVVIQSLNPLGAQNMKRILPEAKVIPAAWDRIYLVDKDVKGAEAEGDS